MNSMATNFTYFCANTVTMHAMKKIIHILKDEFDRQRFVKIRTFEGCFEQNFLLNIKIFINFFNFSQHNLRK